MGIEQKARESIVSIRALANLMRKHGPSPSFADSLEKIADHLESTLRAKAEPVSTAYTLPEARRWPFVESPGEFTERLARAMQEFPLLGAVRHVLIENPPALAQQPAAIPRLANCGKYTATDNNGQHYYLNHANTWQTFQGQQPPATSGEAVAWLAADDTGRVIDAKAKEAGSRASATRAATEIYSIPLYAAPQHPAGELKDSDILWDMRHIEPHLKDVDKAVPTILRGVRKAISRALAAQQQELKS